MNDGARPPPLHLFTLRIWPEDRGGGVCEWWGQAKHLGSGEVRYFRTWAELTQLLPRMLDNVGSSDPGPSDPGPT